MSVTSSPDAIVARIAAAIAAPARLRMVYALVDGRALTSTELAIVAHVTPSTASVHLQHLKAQRLVTVQVQGKHRYYRLTGADVAAILEALSVVAGASPAAAAASPPTGLRAARTCYDHLAGVLGVAVYERFTSRGWLSATSLSHRADCTLTPEGTKVFHAMGIDVEGAAAARRRFAYPCLDWTERRPHLGGALGAAVLDLALRKKWVRRERDSRALRVTNVGRLELHSKFGVQA
ncbi:MAG: ArsR/SmtB family transcription factor [Gemmatimonadaceae bacterium]